MSEGCTVCLHPSRPAIEGKIREGRGVAAVARWISHRREKRDEFGPYLGHRALRAHRVECMGLPPDPAFVGAAIPAADPLVAKLDDPEYVPSDAELSSATRREMLRKIGDLSGKDLMQMRLQELKTEEQRLRVEEKQGKPARGDDPFDELRAGVRGALGHIPARRAS